MGGLVTSTLLTLLVMPVGFVFLHRLDRLFGRLGPWIMIAWILSTTAVMAPLVMTDAISSMRWQIVSALLVAAVLLGVAVLIFRRPKLPQPHAEEGQPPVVEVRYLRKVYGKPGPVGRAWHVSERFAEAVKKFGGQAFDRRDAASRLLPLTLVLAGSVFMSFTTRPAPWGILYFLLSSVLAGAFLRRLRATRGRADALGRVEPGGPENVAAALLPWVAMTYMALRFRVLAWVTNHHADGISPEAKPFFEEEPFDVRAWVLITLAVLMLLIQLGRRTAVRIASGRIPVRLEQGRLRRVRTLWRRFSRFCFGMDLPREQVQALAGVDFRAERGMVGILGPNGAGKTTLLRMLCGILEPSLGTVYIGGVSVKRLKRFLARWVGYLPQDFGLPQDLTAREYLEYYGLLYEIHPAEARRERVDGLLKEVGLAERADEKIGGYSGGMRQRVAVARTLLRLPPVIVVDEPTVGLDPRERIRFRNLLSRLSEGRVVLFSTHVVEDVEVACERVIVLARGRVVFDGPPTDLAAAAEGKVWVVTYATDGSGAPSDEALLVDEVPEADGRTRSRLLAVERPIEGAERVPPTLQDGYLWLVRAERAA
jgi:ABC-type multidrug transport system ATPase subunit